MLKLSRLSALAASQAIIIGSLIGCPKEPEPTEPEIGLEPPRAEMVASHTSGSISRQSAIKVGFTGDLVAEAELNEPLDPSPLKLTPRASGETIWSGTRELRFRPDQPLEPGQRYKAELDLSSVPGLEGRVPRFDFEFFVIPQSFDVTIIGLSPSVDPADDSQELAGRIFTADLASPADVENMLSARHEGDNLEVLWQHALEQRRHSFSVRGISRRDLETHVELTVEGGPIGVDETQVLSVPVPGKDQFVLTQVSDVTVDTRHIEARFSDPLDPDQDLRGLFHSSDPVDLRHTVDGGILRIYARDPWPARVTLVFEPGIRSASGHRLETRATHTLHFEPLPPAVRFVTKGSILPTGADLTLPIETANLSALDVQAIRVPPKNLTQFLQVNPLDGEREMHRVGELAWQDTVNLRASATDSNRYERHALDISPLIEEEPGGLYQIRLSFRPQHSLYECPPGTFREEFLESELPREQVGGEQEQSHWDHFETEQTDSIWAVQAQPWELWRQRKNPCHPGFYKKYGDHDISVTRNVLVTDVGLIAKKGTDGSLFVVATDLRSAEPRSGAHVRVLDYQRQEIVSGWTRLDGTVQLKPERTPYFVVASHHGSEGIVRLQEGSALAVGHLDVGGLGVSEGLKGLLYGERGVWRPGDEIFLTFILHDPSGKLPNDHPISFELVNSRGQVSHRSTHTNSLNGFYHLRTRTEANAPTGNYIARVRVGGATFEETLKIETVMPNRLKIDLDFPDDEVIRGPSPRLETTLRSAWLHGAVARNLRADVELTLRPTETRFEGFDGYSFDDPTRQFRPEPKTIFDGRLDDSGVARIDEPFEPGTPPGMLTANLSTRVFEPSGAYSIDHFEVPVSPYDRYVGIRTPPGDLARGMLLTNEKHPVQIVSVDADGQLVDGVKVDVALYKIQWRWWWESGPEEMPDFTTSASHTPIQQTSLSLEDGRGVFELEVEYPNWGRYLLVVHDREGGHRAGRIVYIDWPGWAGRGMEDRPGAATMLAISSDKTRYAPGDVATLTIPTPHRGRALVTLEDGSRVLDGKWVEARGETTRHSIPITSNMAPGVYASVTLVQPHRDRDNDLPMRLYGTIPLEVEDPNTRLTPKIGSADVFEPQSTVEISMSEQEGRAMTYTLALVDEGLLGLTRFETPDPWSRFYQREALGVTTWDVFDDVAGAFSGSFDRLIAIGGDAEGEMAADTQANRFPPVVRYLGPFALKAGQTKTHKVDIPQYVGAVRLMAVAGQDDAFGRAQKTVLVKRPLMLLATLPRVLGPGEEVELPVSVFALDDDIRDVSIEVEASDGFRVISTSDKEVSFSRTGDQMVSFRLETADRLGVETVRVIARSGQERAEQEIEIDIRHPGERELRIVEGSIEAGETWSRDVTLTGMNETNEISLEISTVAPINLHPHLDYLVTYPHGCLEQVMSGVFPQLHLTNLVSLDSARRAEVTRNIKAGVARVSSHQTVDGGFGYWPADSRSHDWTSSYAGHFLLEARQKGHPIPSGLLQRWEGYQRRLAQAFVPGTSDASDLAQAYRLYTLALAGATEMGAMNRLREWSELSQAARWRLAAAYKLAGQPEAARSLAREATTEVAPYTTHGSTFGSRLRDQAMILETMVLLEDRDGAFRIAREISEALDTSQRLGTQELAFSLSAMARATELLGDSTDMTFGYEWHGKKGVVTESKPIHVLELPLVEADEAPVLKVTNNGSSALFARLVTQGLPRVGEETPAARGLKVEVDYESLQGEALDVSRLEQGSDLVAKVTVTNTRRQRLSELALTKIVPSGWEIRAERALGRVQEGEDSFDYRDVRDDRVHTYFDLDPGETKTFQIRLHSAYPGRFYRPGTSVEAMYDATIHGRTRGGWVEVLRPGLTG